MGRSKSHGRVRPGTLSAKIWADDPEWWHKAHMPQEIGFATKPAIARAMIKRVLAAHHAVLLGYCRQCLWGRGHQNGPAPCRQWIVNAKHIFSPWSYSMSHSICLVSGSREEVPTFIRGEEITDIGKGVR
jgi:hypothetical protein